MNLFSDSMSFLSRSVRSMPSLVIAGLGLGAYGAGAIIYPNNENLGCIVGGVGLAALGQLLVYKGGVRKKRTVTDCN